MVGWSDGAPADRSCYMWTSVDSLALSVLLLLYSWHFVRQYARWNEYMVETKADKRVQEALESREEDEQKEEPPPFASVE